MGEPVEVDRRGDVVHAVLTRPTLCGDMVRQLADAIGAAESAPGCRLLVLSSAGPSFCRGMGIEGPRMPSWMEAPDNPLWTLLERLTRSTVATVALVGGAAEGGGVGLAAACDIVLAGPGASFRLGEVTLGLLPAVILPFIARRVGAQRSFHLALTARTLDADAAVGIGLADTAVADLDHGLRVLRRDLRRSTDDAVADLKRYHTALHPLRGSAEQATALLRDRFAAPATRARLAAFHREGLLP
ncbi:enoyl-CoA hydratase/isomerase family protein [Streptomyces sp. NPDC002520]